jgi:hypothetical protein
MRLSKQISRIGAAAMLSAALLGAPAIASDDQRFSALNGVEAQALSVEEMQAISGELNAYDIAASLFALATKYAAYPRLSAFYTKLANETLANAVQLNAFFARVGILTPCTGTLCP